MAEKQDKLILEREYTVPLRAEWLKVPQYKRAARAIKALKEFIAKHMKVEERDTRKVKIDRYLNEEMWFKGIRKPLAKVKVKAKKYDSGNVTVELSEIPAFVKFKIDKENRAKKPVERVEKKIEEKKEEKEEDKAVREEKKEAVKEAGMLKADKQAREMKHEITDKKGIKKPLQRMALQK